MGCELPKARPTALGVALKSRRKTLRLSPAETAKRLGLDPASYRRWESGVKRVSASFMPKVLAFLGDDPRPEPATLAEKVKSKRKALGMNQGELASRLGMHKGSVERLEQSGHAGARLRAVFEEFVRG